MQNRFCSIALEGSSFCLDLEAAKTDTCRTLVPIDMEMVQRHLFSAGTFAPEKENIREAGICCVPVPVHLIVDKLTGALVSKIIISWRAARC